MQKFEVGKPLKEGKNRYPEVPIFEFEQAGGVLYVFYKTPKDKEVEAFRSGDVKLGILYKEGIIFLLFKFGSANWLDVPYCWHLSEPYTFQPLEKGMGYGMTMIFSDANTGIVKVIRQIGWPNRMSKIFRGHVEDQQQDKDFYRVEYERKLQNIYNNYSTDDMVKMADTFRLRGEGA